MHLASDGRLEAMPPLTQTSSWDAGEAIKSARCSTLALYGVLTVDCSSLGLADAAAAVNRIWNDLDHANAYHGTMQVEALHLDQNQLTGLRANTFGRRLPQLQRLILAGNLISSVDAEAFTGLNQLMVIVAGF